MHLVAAQAKIALSIMLFVLSSTVSVSNTSASASLLSCFVWKISCASPLALIYCLSRFEKTTGRHTDMQ